MRLTAQACPKRSIALKCFLKREAHVLGRLHPSGWRVVTMSPLAVTFRVSMDDRLVKVMSVFYRPKPTS
jgi:hypothetical protein